METRSRSVGRHALALVALACAWPSWAIAQTPANPGGLIYTCTTAEGRHITADRPIAECAGRTQRILNRDGSLRQIIGPPLTPEERAEKEAQERKAAAELLAKQEARRRDRNLLSRYPDEAAHNRAREAALDSVREAMKLSEVRLKELALDRANLKNEAEFYKGKALPAKLQQAIDSNEAAAEAQRALTSAQQAELTRVNRIYDLELERLRKLRAGATPGSLGPLESSVAAVEVNPTSASTKR